MKFTIDRNTLLKPLGHIYSVVERRNTIPILSNVLIESNASQVSFTATDMDIDIVETVGCIVSRQGKINFDLPAETSTFKSTRSICISAPSGSFLIISYKV